MRRLAALVIGGAALLLPAPARADEPDPEKVARIIEQIKAHRAEKERAARRNAPTPGALRRLDALPREPRSRAPRTAPRTAPRPAPGGGAGGAGGEEQ